MAKKVAKRKVKVSSSVKAEDRMAEPTEETVFIDATEAVEDKVEDKVEVGSSFTLNNRLLIIKVDTGDMSTEAADAEIKNVESTLGKLLSDNKVNCLLYVTHNKMQIELV